MQISIGAISEWSPFEPANLGRNLARPVKRRKRLPMPAWSYPVCIHASAGRAHSTAMRAMLGCMDRDDDAHGKTHGRVRLAETGVGIGGTNPHLKHALERRQYPLCGREILSVYPPTDYTRQQRSAYGHTHADRPSKCRRQPGKLEAARRAAKRKPRRPICTPPASACVRDIRRESASG